MLFPLKRQALVLLASFIFILVPAFASRAGTPPRTAAAPPGGLYNANPLIVTLTCEGIDAGCDIIYYTTDGSTPTTTSSVYTSPIVIATDATLLYFGVDLAGNIEPVNAQAYTFDTVPPAGSIAINGGAAYAATAAVALVFSCSDSSGCAQMQFSNDNLDWSAPLAYAASTTWTLLPGDGAKTVYARFMDAAGNWSDPSVAAIILDSSLPAVAITSPTTGLMNTGTPVVSYTVSEGTPVVKVDGAVVSKASGSTLDALADGVHTVRVESTDMAGNKGFSEVTFTVDTVSPSGPLPSWIKGGSAHAVSVQSDGTLWTWGANSNGQLGDGTVVNKSTPTRIGTGNKWLSVAAGSNHTMALQSDGTLWAWGANSSGQLGDGTIVSKSTPTRIGTDNKWVQVSGGSSHTVALKSDGTLWAWGANSNGQLGNGTLVSKNTPTRVGTDNTWISIAAGNNHTIAMKSDGSLWAWGLNTSGQLGIATTVSKSSPTRIGSDTTWAAIAAGSSHTIALKSDGTLWAWGANSSGQLGDGTIVNKNTPTRIGADNKWVSIAAGNNHTIALKSDGTLWAWGANSSGQLGDGTVVTRNSPVQIGTDTKWTSITGGTNFTEALKSDGSLWAWGVNTSGQLGDGTAAGKTSPANIRIPGALFITSSSKFVNTAAVTLRLAALDPNGIAQMQFSNDNAAWSAPAAYAPTADWTLIPGDGTKTVYARFMDAAGNWSSLFSDTIALETAAPSTAASPVGGIFNISKKVALYCSDGKGSGCSKIYYTTDGSLPTMSSSTYTTSFNIASSTILKYFAVDLAGNSEAVKTQVYVIDATPPAGSVTIGDGRPFVRTPAVLVTLSCSDATGCSQMQFSNDNLIWSAPATYATTTAWILTAGDGAKTVYAKLKDGAGNWSAAITAAVMVDSVPPTAGVSPAEGVYGTAQTVTLSCSDAGGCAGIYYTLDGTTPSAASAFYAGPFTIGATTTLKYIAVDLAGNSGAVQSVTYVIGFDTTPPAGAVAVNSNAAYTATSSVALSLSCSDASGCTQMQFSNDAVTWSAPEPYASIKAWTLSQGEGAKYIYARFADFAGNWSSPAGCSIVLDTGAPTGTITINSDAPTTNTSGVVLNLDCNDASGCDRMQFSNDNTTWSNPIPYAATSEWTLGTGFGSRTVYAAFQDRAGNWSAAVSATVTVISPIEWQATSGAHINSGSNGTVTWQHTVTDGNSKILIVTSALDSSSGAQAKTATFNGTLLTKINTVTSADRGESTTMWYMLEPPVGSYEVTITYGGSHKGMQTTATTYAGVSQNRPLASSVTATASASSGPATVTIASAAGDLVVDSLGYRNYGALTPDPSQTVRYNQHDASTSHAASSKPGAPSVTMSWALENPASWAMIAVGLRPAVSPTVRTVTVKPSGGDYTSLQAALAGEAADLVALNRQLDIECYSMADTAKVNIPAAFITDPDHSINIYTPLSERHAGTWSDSKYRLDIQATKETGETYPSCIWLRGRHVWFEGIQVRCTSTCANYPSIVVIDPLSLPAATMRFSESILVGNYSGGMVSNSNAITLRATTTAPDAQIYISNSEVRDLVCTSAASGGRMIHEGGPSTVSWYVDNVTLYNATNALALASGASAAHVRNSVAAGLLPGGSSWTSSRKTSGESDYNRSSLQETLVGGHSVSNATPAFVDVSNRDLRLQASDTAAKDRGVNTLNNPLVNGGIDGNGFIRDANWDIGAYEY